MKGKIPALAIKIIELDNRSRKIELHCSLCQKQVLSFVIWETYRWRFLRYFDFLFSPPAFRIMKFAIICPVCVQRKGKPPTTGNKITSIVLDEAQNIPNLEKLLTGEIR